MIYTFLLSITTNLITLVATSTADEPWWISLIVSVASPIFYLLCSISLNSILTTLRKKGKLTKKQAEDLQRKVDDYVDDGKLNDSNKEDKKNGK